MSIENLGRRPLIQTVPPSLEEARQQLELSRRDVRTASRLLSIDLDWPLIAAYNGALQAGIAYMQARGGCTPYGSYVPSRYREAYASLPGAPSAARPWRTC